MTNEDSTKHKTSVALVTISWRSLLRDNVAVYFVTGATDVLCLVESSLVIFIYLFN